MNQLSDSKDCACYQPFFFNCVSIYLFLAPLGLCCCALAFSS